MLADRVIPAPTDPRVSIRLEAENFRVLDRVEVEYVNDRKASKRMSVRGTGEGAYRIETSFFEPYTAVELSNTDSGSFKLDYIQLVRR